MKNGLTQYKIFVIYYDNIFFYKVRKYISATLQRYFFVQEAPSTRVARAWMRGRAGSKVGKMITMRRNLMVMMVMVVIVTIMLKMRVMVMITWQCAIWEKVDILLPVIEMATGPGQWDSLASAEQRYLRHLDSLYLCKSFGSSHPSISIDPPLNHWEGRSIRYSSKTWCFLDPSAVRSQMNDLLGWISLQIIMKKMPGT